MLAARSGAACVTGSTLASIGGAGRTLTESSERVTPMRVVVLGAGAVGAYYGGQLARLGHEVTCFARGANLAAIGERGLEVRTPEGVFRAPVKATEDLDALLPADFAILAVKSYSLA